MNFFQRVFPATLIENDDDQHYVFNKLADEQILVGHPIWEPEYNFRECLKSLLRHSDVMKSNYKTIISRLEKEKLKREQLHLIPIDFLREELKFSLGQAIQFIESSKWIKRQAELEREQRKNDLTITMKP